MGRADDAQAAEAEREDRLQRVLHENIELKREVLELQDKLKVLRVKFTKVTRDLKRLSPDLAANIKDASTSPASDLRHVKARAASTSMTAKSLSASCKRQLSEHPTDAGAFYSAGGDNSAELQRCLDALRNAQEEVTVLRAMVSAAVPKGESASVGGSQSQASPTMLTVLEQLRRDFARAVEERDLLNAENTGLRDQLTRTRAELEAIRLSQAQDSTLEKRSNSYFLERAQTTESIRQSLEGEYRKSLETLTRERDGLALQLRLLQEERNVEKRGITGMDSIQLLQLESEMKEKSNQIAILTSRMQASQQQVDTLKCECTRLLDEIKKLHFMHAENKRLLLESENEKSLLQVRCARVEELERTVQHKHEELLRTEQELLRTAGTLQSCNRETEEAVRREYATRIADLQEMRDCAESHRREKERQLIEAQREIVDLRRQLELSREHQAMYREQFEKVQREKENLTTLSAVAGHAVEEFGDETVKRALAVAALRRESNSKAINNSSRKDSDTPLPSGGLQPQDMGTTTEAAEALNMWDALSWDEGWEAKQLREALASAALDMELAETRCAQMNEQVEQSRGMLQKISNERDALLEENIEMRRRLTHVQTVFARQQMESYRVAQKRNSKAEGIESRHTNGAISFCIRSIQYDERLLCAIGIGNAKAAAMTLFFSLDGLHSYDTMLSSAFYSLNEPLDIHFQYNDLETNEVTLEEIQRATFVLQLHKVHGTSNKIVAMAEIPGITLLQARETSITESVQLIGGTGENLATIVLEICATNIFCQTLLASTYNSTTEKLITSDELKSTLLAMRNIIALRIQVFKAENLLGSPMPQPYVFYTTTGSHKGLSCVRDTVVHTHTRTLTASPIFDLEPVDHRVVVDRDLLLFVLTGTVVFVVFDAQASDVRANLGVAEVPLRPLLASPRAVVRTTEVLHPQGTLSVGLSWVCRE
ncbi:First C2 domain [Trypanosoma vivax]|uniref:C2 domain-containing protein n=1 Tax=Trypanosoma vivax (strain Y486) TaxID=1055687 RepID=G0TTL5_TRYVY|nr:First C2 domain [Trypanosoma vivax]CCC47296.1 conserved hypothetical protein [Trypanosoma vivax Y486]